MTCKATAKHWSVVNSSGYPTARSGHCATVANDALYVFGGCGHPASKAGGNVSIAEDQLPAEAMPVCLGDLHVYDLARQRWSEVAFAAPAADSGEPRRPAERTCAAMCASDGGDEDQLFLSGGAGDDPYDLRGCCWEFCVRRRTWRLLYEGGSSGISPCRRIGHTMVHDSARNRLVIFGGSTGLEYFDDTQAFDLATGTWTALATTGERPSPRYKHQAFVDSDFMYVVGGGSFEPEGPDLDVYRLPLRAGGAKSLEWERVRPTGTPPRCRAAHGLAWDRVGRAAYIWGGFTSGMELDSTFYALRLPPTAPTLSASGVSEEASVAAAPAPIPPATAVASLNFSSSARGGVGGDAAAAAAAAAAGVRSSDLPAPPAQAVIGPSQDMVGLTEAVGRSNSTRIANARNRRPLSADGAGVIAATGVEAAARENKPLGGARGEGRGRRASPSASEFAEQQQWQQEEQHLQRYHQLPPSQEQQQQQQQEQQEPQPERPPDVDETRSPPGQADGRERWRRRGQRLWRQGSNAERAGGNEGHGNVTAHRRGGNRRPWRQGWATGRLQGLWGGSGAAAGGSNRAPPPPPRLAALPVPPPPTVAVGTSSAALVSVSQIPVSLDTVSSTIDSAAVVLAGEELSWVTLPSGQGGGAACATAEGAAHAPPSPAGRSFHCAFFHGGACYVTGGSDGARKFGDMWRFCARETPPPLMTLAARAFVSKERNTAVATSCSGADGSSGSISHPELLESLPGELREALRNMNMQAELVL